MYFYFRQKMWQKTGKIVLPLCRNLMTQSVKSPRINELWDKIIQKSLSNSEALNFCQHYRLLENKEKRNFLHYVANEYGIDTSHVKKTANAFLLPQNKTDDVKLMLNAAEKLKSSLQPKYSIVFNTVSTLEGGIKFLVDLQADLIDLLSNEKSEDGSYSMVKALSNHLKEVLSFCFSIGFLTLERITWNSSCHMLQKISEYEAVHPVRNWTDLKQRVGLYRRCYVFTHSSMPSEPIVMLHTALTEEISSSINDIVLASGQSTSNAITNEIKEDEKKINAAIFYSITSTQAGLRGIELGNQLIKKVVGEILKEFPHISKFSSLSPIPGFKEWLLVEISKAKEDASILHTIFSGNEISKISEKNTEFWNSLSYAIGSNRWISNEHLKEKLMKPLMKSCAYYLLSEKRRSYALNSVAHFHLRNGAVLWRLNWAADLSPRGLDNSCGMMVNYRYFMDETEKNSQSYNHDHNIKVSDAFKELIT